jgi:hypothetical protein
MLLGRELLSILVYDMPQCKWFLLPIAALANLSQMGSFSAIGLRQ